MSSRRRPTLRKSVDRLIPFASAIVLLTAIGCKESTKPAETEQESRPSSRAPDGNVENPLPALVAALSRGSAAALESCVLDVRYGKRGDYRKATIALQFPGRMRRESRDDKTVRLEKLFDAKHWASPAAASDGTREWKRMPDAGVREFESLRLLLGCLLAWDLKSTLQETSKATWFREQAAPIIHRDFDDAGRLTTISVDGTRWNVKGWHEERGGFLPEVESTDGRSLRFDRVSLGSQFLDRYFEPRREDDKGYATLKRDVEGDGSEIQVGEPKLNFDKPMLEHAAATQYIEADVPETWSGRLRVVAELGNKLGALGQRPDGLPAYVDGKVRVHYAAGTGKLTTPKGFTMKKRPKGNVLVLHKRIAFADAVAAFEPVLTAFAKKHNYFPAGPILLLPHELPRADEASQPEDGATVLIRAELPIR